jgi:hypothetical protein
MLLDDIIKVRTRSTAELTADELAGLFHALSDSITIKRYVSEHRPRGGGMIFGFVPMFLLYVLMECRRQTYRGMTKNLTIEEAFVLGFPIKDDMIRIPAASTLNSFVNHILIPNVMQPLSKEFGECFISMSEEKGILTIDSTPVEACHGDKDAEFNPHYRINMKKAHIAMRNGMPLCMEYSGGNDGDNPYARPLLESCKGMGAGRKNISMFMADGSYDAFETFGDVWETIGVQSRMRLHSNHVLSEDACPEEIDRVVNRNWKHGGSKDMPMAKKLTFLCSIDKKELAGMYLRNLCITDPLRDIRLKDRWECEVTHSSMKQWIDFTVRGTRIKTRESTVRCKFLCVQVLCALFIPA